MTTTEQTLPPLPAHPEPHTMKWSKLEEAAIRAYASEAVRNALATQAPTKFRVGDRIVEHPDNGHGYATVTELTERGFKYVLDTPYTLHWALGKVTGGESFYDNYWRVATDAATQAPALTDEPKRRDWNAIEKHIDDYLEDYEMRDTCQILSDGEIVLMKEAIIGLLSDSDFRALLAAASPTPTEDALDAKRWRYIRRKICFTGNGDGTASMHAINLPDRAAWPEEGEIAEGVDAAIDAAIASTPIKGETP